jgi:hypothetical protein
MHWLLTPIILAIWKAESQRIAVQGQPGQKLETLWCMAVIPCTVGSINRKIEVWARPGKK